MPNEGGRLDVASQIRNQLRVLREQKWLVLLCVLLAVGVSFAYVQSQRKLYEAEAKVLVQPDNLLNALNGVGAGATDPVRQAATDSQIAALPVLQQQVTRQLRLPRPPDGLAANSQGDANVIAIDVQDRDPGLAARFANAYANEYISFRRENSRRRYVQALALVQSRLRQARRRGARSVETLRLRDQGRQLQLLSGLQTGDAQVVQQADVPTAPFKPQRTRTLIAGLLIGLVLGAGLAFLRDKLDRRVKSEEQVRELLPDVPVIGTIPQAGRGDKSKALTMESFHQLQANVGFVSPDGRMRSLLVTSASPGEGKSTVSANLALAMAAHGRNAVVLEADLRRPGLSDGLGIDREAGVSRILVGEGSLASSVRHTQVEPSRNGDGPTMALSGDLVMVPAGPTPPNPQVLLNERRLEGLLAEARAQSDTVIVDGPPMGLFSDMLPVAKRVDGVIVAVRLYHSRSDEIRRFVEQLEAADIKPVGVVVLGTDSDLPSYYSY